MVALRAARLERGLSLRALARRAGVATSTVYALEMGRHVPQLRVIRQLSEALACNPWDIDEFRSRLETNLRPPAP
ncbi:MAG TPA: helix-turn-helix transcriptional regulator [Chloroflexota bacterium]|jgi:transcriptional regulator with XRE-family HTH domain|nr:helix-turn-helix transcriptional regulator [Chloroflexota bacterium]HZU05351.1 helix-turn-helix transcriptional regulator [Chloroflexota bacterium]